MNCELDIDELHADDYKVKYKIFRNKDKTFQFSTVKFYTDDNEITLFFDEEDSAINLVGMLMSQIDASKEEEE